MPNRKKFKLGDIAVYLKPFTFLGVESRTLNYVIIVDFRQDGAGRGYYRVVRTLHPENGALYGETVWVQPHYLTPLADSVNRYDSAVRTYRANERMKLRGCRCQCCPHEAINKGSIREDGSFIWEEAHE